MLVALSKDNRLVLLETVPFHGAWKYYKVLQDLRDLVGFNGDEIAAWDEVSSRRFEVEAAAVEITVATLDDLRDAGRITPQQEALYAILAA